jgi:HEAT repeat protein/cyclophilin family peptidyl-prolyl cis-trans isomerase
VTSFRRALAVLLVLAASACVSVPTQAPVVGPTYEQKLGWILRLEDRRALHDAVPPPVPVAAPVGKKRKQVAPPPPTAVPDLVALLKDRDSRVRRRAALAVGRVRLAAGVAPLSDLLAADPEPEVRQMAAFGLGLSGHSDAAAALRTALGDQSPIVRGRAADALGLIGDTASAPAVAAMVAAYVKAGALASLSPNDEGYPLAPEIEAARLGIYALVRLKAYDPLAAAVLDGAGAPVTRWWPVAYALGRIHDPRAIPALRLLVAGEGAYTRGFAARGLGAAKDGDAIDLLRPLVAAVAKEPGPAVEAVRALGEIADPRALPTLVDLLKARGVQPGIRAEAVKSIGKLRAPASVDVLLDVLSDPSPAVRAEALSALAALDPPRFLATLSGLDADRHWSVRAALATVLGTLPAESAVPLLEPMAADKDQRVLPAVLEALAQVKAPRAAAIAVDKLKADDPVVRAAAARALGELKPEGASDQLKAAAEYAVRDSMYVARVAALTALVEFGKAAAEPSLTAALADKDWAVRLKAAELLHQLDPTRDDQVAIRPAPTRLDATAYSLAEVVTPKVSTELYIDTDKGTIHVALAVLDAPLTVRTIIELARSGYFGGVAIHRVVPDFVMQDGDPRGDGEGGPGFTIRDELNERPYRRGTLGMALDWADTGGSQFFITHSPQPHLDAKYTVFGEVISGMDVVDKLAQGDVIRGVRVWDGTIAPAPPTPKP